MSLWILERIKYDKYKWNITNAWVIRALTEESARAIACKECGDEDERERTIWLDSDKTTCKVLSVDGPEEMILQDYTAG
jgi:hypothetical protein